MKKTEKWVAKPHINDKIGLAVFDDKKKAVKYLRDTTAYLLREEDWVMLGKLWKVND